MLCCISHSSALSCQVYQFPYARKRILEEYVNDYLMDSAGMRKHKGKDHDSKRSYESCRQDVNAIVALWSQEMFAEDNPIRISRAPAEIESDETCRHLTRGEYAERDYGLGPRTPIVAQLLDAIHVLREQESLDNFDDKAFRSNLVDFSEKQYFDSLSACWDIAHQQPGGSVHNALTCAVGMSWGASTLLRGDSQQRLTFSDLWSDFHKDTDYICVHAVCNQGKTMAVGQRQHAACYRNKDPLRCAVAHLAFLNMWRFHKMGEPYPNFTKRSYWLNKHVMASENNPEKGIADKTYDAVIKMCHVIARVSSSALSPLSLPGSALSVACSVHSNMCTPPHCPHVCSSVLTLYKHSVLRLVLQSATLIVCWRRCRLQSDCCVPSGIWVGNSGLSFCKHATSARTR